MIQLAFLTAAKLLSLMLTPLSANGLSVSIFLLVTINASGKTNPLLMSPSAIAVPKFPPPIIAIFLFMALKIDKQMPKRNQDKYSYIYFKVFK